MVTTKLLGGLCNNMFQIAHVLGYCLKHNLEYCIPLKVDNPHYVGQQPYIFPKVKYCDKEYNLTIYNEMNFHYEEIPRLPDVCFYGYWQSFLYQHGYRDEILKAFGFDKIVTKVGICSIHYRGTDYHKLPSYHPIISMEYIKHAVTRAWFEGYRKYRVFSDDIPEIKSMIEQESLFNSLEFEYSEGNDELTDLLDMASCESNITANSSFSLWAAYINPNPKKIVISPRKWFGMAVNHSTKDLYLEGSIIL